MLRQRTAASLDWGLHLQLRMHVLCHMCAVEASRPMPELRRWAAAAPRSRRWPARALSCVDEKGWEAGRMRL